MRLQDPIKRNWLLIVLAVLAVATLAFAGRKVVHTHGKPKGYLTIPIHVQDQDGNPLEGIRIVVTTLEPDNADN